MFRFLFFSFLAGLFGWSRPVYYVHNDINVDVEGSDGYSVDGDNCDYAADDTYYDGGSDSGGD